MVQLQGKIITNVWVKSDWDTYKNTIESPDREKNTTLLP